MEHGSAASNLATPVRSLKDQVLLVLSGRIVLFSVLTIPDTM